MSFEKVADLAQLPDETPVRAEVAGVPIALVRVGDDVHCLHDTCSHQDYSLSEGLVWDCQLECALHGSMFDLRTGEPESLPATTAVPVFPVEIDGDAVLVDVEHPLNDAPFPEH